MGHKIEFAKAMGMTFVGMLNELTNPAKDEAERKARMAVEHSYYAYAEALGNRTRNEKFREKHMREYPNSPYSLAEKAKVNSRPPERPHIVQPTNSHFRFTDEVSHLKGRSMHRIIAVKDFLDIKKGELGGFIQNMNNIAPNSYAWVYGNAMVGDGAVISGHARIYGNAQVYGSARVFDHAEVYGHAQIMGNAMVYEDAHVFGHAMVCEKAQVYGNAVVNENTIVAGNTHIYGGPVARPRQAPVFNNG